MKLEGNPEHDDRLLESLENIISTAGLKVPIKTALVGVERLGEERANKVSRLRLVEKEKARLDAEQFRLTGTTPCMLPSQYADS